MSKEMTYTSIAVVAAVVVVGYFFFIHNSAGISQTLPIQSSNTAVTQQQITPSSSASASPNSVVIQDIKVGVGAAAAAGMTVQVNYVGKLQDGTVFDQSSSHGGPFSFTLGAGQVIPGWDQGVVGMKVGGERVLIIPSSLAYGSQQVGPIPPNSTLTFDVTLVSIDATPSPATQ